MMTINIRFSPLRAIGGAAAVWSGLMLGTPAAFAFSEAEPAGGGALTWGGPVLFALLVGGALGAGLAALVLGRQRRRLSILQARLAELVDKAAEQEFQSRNQNSLNANIELLRRTLYGFGEPRRVGSDLWFGSHRVNGQFDAVDKVKASFGGTATVFLMDERVSTNVQKADGARAIGTKLAPGPVYDRVLKEGRSYRGEAEILGERYITIYEPIFSDGAVIGILYAGTKVATRPQSARPRERDPASAIAQAIEALAQVLDAQAKTRQAALAHDEVARDAGHARDIERQMNAREQRRTVMLLAEGLAHLAQGDLVYRLNEALGRGYEQLREDFNAAMHGVAAAIGAVSDNAQLLRTDATEIGQSALDLSRRTEQQAASLQQTAASLSQITDAVRKTAEGARQAKAIGEAAHRDVEQSGRVSQDAVAAIGAIASSSRQIGQIIGVIDEIAFQTNLLALNAGVEAARAGDAGRGFAVVASEVRALAQRAAEAAKEIKTLIDVSGRQVAQGVACVTDTGDALSRIMASVVDLSGVVSEIATSAQEQAAALQDVNGALAQMDRVTQQNVAMVEQSTAASRRLADNSEHLAQLIGRFNVEGVSAPPAMGLKRAG
jgi:methyl-accepting chemotaxis protein